MDSVEYREQLENRDERGRSADRAARTVPVAPLEALLDFPHWTYIDGVLTAVVLPEAIRAVLAAHPADAPAQAPEPSADVVDRAAEVIGVPWLLPEYARKAANRLAAARLLVDPAETERLTRERDEQVEWAARKSILAADNLRRAEKAEAERDRARDLAARLEADNARLTQERIDHLAQLSADDWTRGRLEADARAARQEAERLEGVIERVRAVADRWRSYADRCSAQDPPHRPKVLWAVAGQKIDAALSDGGEA